MTPYIGHGGDAVPLLEAALNTEYNNHDLSDFMIDDYECTLRELLEELLDAIRRGIV